MVLYVRTYEAANAYGPLEQFDVDPATTTVMDIMRRVRKSTTLHNRHVRVGMRLYTYADHVPGDLINDTEKDPMVLSATLDELQQSGCVKYEESRHGLHLKVLVDGCRTGEEATEFVLEQSWRMEYAHAAQARDLAAQARELAALTREVEELKEERDVAVRFARAAIQSAMKSEKMKRQAFPYQSRSWGRFPGVPPESLDFIRLLSDVTMDAAGGGDVCTLRVMYKLLRKAPDVSDEGHIDGGHYILHGGTIKHVSDTYLPIRNAMRPVHHAPYVSRPHQPAGNNHNNSTGQNRIQHHETSYLPVVGEDGMTPLFLAAKNGHMDIVRMLVKEFGADVNTTDNYGKPLLHLASESGNVDAVRVLVKELGADVKAMSNDGCLLLHIASLNGHVDIVRALVNEFGMNVSDKDRYGEAPLHAATRNRHLDTVRLLVKELGADINIRSRDNRTPLDLAAENGHVDTVRALVEEFGVEVNASPNGCSSALSLAKNNCHNVTADLLLKYGAVPVEASYLATHYRIIGPYFR